MRWRELRVTDRIRLASYLRLITNFYCDRVKLDGDAKLCDCGVEDGSTISLIMLPPFELYVQGTDQRMHTVVVPSSEPEVASLSYKFRVHRKYACHVVCFDLHSE